MTPNYEILNPGTVAACFDGNAKLGPATLALRSASPWIRNRETLATVAEVNRVFDDVAAEVLG